MAGAKRTAAGKTGQGRSADGLSSTRVEKPLRPSQCREYMRQTLAREFRGIVQGFVEGAKTGSCQHVKLAAELMERPARSRTRGNQSVQRLLEKLEREEQAERCG